jgi:hypothetical protein
MDRVMMMMMGDFIMILRLYLIKAAFPAVNSK